MIMIVVVRITVMMLRLTISDGNEHKSVNNDADDSSENDNLDRAHNVTVLVFVSVQTNVKLSFLHMKHQN